MPTAMQLMKSKTVDCNAAYFALVAILGAYGIEIPVEAAVGGNVVMNFILRCVTKKPLSEK